MRNGRTNKPAKSAADAPIQSVASSGNVFADLGIPNPDLALAKAELVQRIRDIIAERKLTQSHAATLLGIDQPKVSALVRGRVDGYSLDRLFRFLNALGQEVEINVRPLRSKKSGARGSILVTR
jgi:predicted XRE-type DNA-binding protein